MARVPVREGKGLVDAPGDQRYLQHVRIRGGHREGVALASQLALIDARGEVRVEPWPAAAPALAARCDPERAGATIDDSRRNLLDDSRADDQLRLSARAPQPPGLPRLFLWAQLLLALVGA
jgi:hypothetical protein